MGHGELAGFLVLNFLSPFAFDMICWKSNFSRLLGSHRLHGMIGLFWKKNMPPTHKPGTHQKLNQKPQWSTVWPQCWENSNRKEVGKLWLDFFFFFQHKISHLFYGQKNRWRLCWGHLIKTHIGLLDLCITDSASSRLHVYICFVCAEWSCQKPRCELDHWEFWELPTWL